MASVRDSSMLDKIVPGLLASGSPKASFGLLRHLILYDLSTRVVPATLSALGRFFGDRAAKRVRAEMSRRARAGDGVRAKQSALVLDRNFAPSGSSNDLFDAVLSVSTDVADARFARRTAKGVLYVDTSDEVRIAPEIFCKKVSTSEVDGELELMTIEVYSYAKNLVELRDFLTELECVYLKTKGNQLGRQLYYFDELPVAPPLKFGKDNTEELDLSKALPTLTFTMFNLYTNKSLKNLYGASARQAKKRADFFINNPQWYADRGVPHTLGILMHGAPGCGKTSFIKALANDTKRHVVNLKLGPTTTIRQINSLFYTSRLSVVRDGASLTYDIPVDKRIIVMEDVDCLSCVVREAPGENADPNRLNLSVLLNILDGVLETPGRIVIMTTNCPDKLDKALKRPGRIDVAIEFKKCSAEDTVEMVEGIAGIAVPPLVGRAFEDGKWTPAEVTRTIFENLDDPAVLLDVFKRPADALPSLTPARLDSTLAAPADPTRLDSTLATPADPTRLDSTLATPADPTRLDSVLAAPAGPTRLDSTLADPADPTRLDSTLAFDPQFNVGVLDVFDVARDNYHRYARAAPANLDDPAAPSIADKFQVHRDLDKYPFDSSFFNGTSMGTLVAKEHAVDVIV